MHVTAVSHRPVSVETGTLTSDFFQSFYPPPLYMNQIHLWVASLRTFSPLIPQIHPFLFGEDREKAGQFYCEVDQRRALISRGVLRRLMGEYTRLSPSKIRFEKGKNGKPVFATPGLPHFSFNVSHSEDLLLFAFSRHRHIGVDVEHIRPMDDYAAMAAQFFHPMELAWLHGVVENLRLPAFYDLWTRKEAYVKATGDGLTHALDSFSVVGERAGRGLFLVENDRGNHTQGVAVMPAPDYPAAVVVI